MVIWAGETIALAAQRHSRRFSSRKNVSATEMVALSTKTCLSVSFGTAGTGSPTMVVKPQKLRQPPKRLLRLPKWVDSAAEPTISAAEMVVSNAETIASATETATSAAEMNVSANMDAKTMGTKMTTEMILGFASRYACLGDLDMWAASRLQVACK